MTKVVKRRDSAMLSFFPQSPVTRDVTAFRRIEHMTSVDARHRSFEVVVATRTCARHANDAVVRIVVDGSR